MIKITEIDFYVNETKICQNEKRFKNNDKFRLTISSALYIINNTKQDNGLPQVFGGRRTHSCGRRHRGHRGPGGVLRGGEPIVRQ